MSSRYQGSAARQRTGIVTISGPDDVVPGPGATGDTGDAQVTGRAGGAAQSRVLKLAAKLWRGRWLWPGLVVVLFCVPLFVGLGRTDLDNDESIYSFAVDVMLKSGDWLTPKSIPSEDAAFLEKPPLKFWIVAAPIRLGLLPHDEFGFRFWDAVMGSVAFLYVFAIGRRLAGPACGIAAVLILFAHQPLLFEHGLRSNNMEAAVVLCYCAGVYHFLAWMAEDSSGRRRRHILALGLYFVLGFMTKFVAALFLPLVLAIAAVLSRDGRWRLRSDWRAWLGVSALVLALVAPWFLYQYHQFGREVWKTMFSEHVLTRFTAYLDVAHLNPWYYYFSRMFSELRVSGVMAITIAGLVLMLLKTVRDGWRDGGVILLWFALPMVLISVLSSKLYHYAYPFLPPVALAAGYGAAVVVRLTWSLAARTAEHANAGLQKRLPAALRSPALQASFLALGVAAIAVAVATHATGGHLRLAVGDTVLFRNASALRAWLAAAIMLTLAARLGDALRVGTVAVLVVLLLPTSGYTQVLAWLPAERHPLRSIGQCMEAAAARSRPGEVAPGMWVEAGALAHFYFYYFRGLGHWQYRPGASDPTVFMHLYVPSMRTPVLLSTARYEQFTRAPKTGDPDLPERVARKTGLDVATVKADAERTDTAMVMFPHEVLILPGPFSGCVATAARLGLPTAHESAVPRQR
jgi:4-amino-4-deoxy-L-arabinose transferase-like glycosyltransferase